MKWVRKNAWKLIAVILLAGCSRPYGATVLSVVHPEDWYDSKWLMSVKADLDGEVITVRVSKPVAMSMAIGDRVKIHGDTIYKLD